MNEKALQLIEDLGEVSQTALLLSKRCATLAGHAAKLLESTATPGNMPTTPCCYDCGGVPDSSGKVVHVNGCHGD